MNEYDLKFMLLTDFREPSILSLELMHFKFFVLQNREQFKF